MYKILGADQKEYGPAPASVIERWIAERRLDGRSRIRRDGEPIWRPLSDFPEFAAALAAGPRKDLGTTTGSSGLAKPNGSRVSGLAISSLIIGLLAPCTAGVAGLVGIILATVALKQIRKSHGQLKGRGLAWTGLTLSGLFLVAIPPLVISAIVARQNNFRAGGPAADPGQECQDHARQLAEAVRRHANDNNDRFPAARTWCDAIQPAINGLNTYQCPLRGDLRCGYALNAGVAEKTRFETAPDTVLIFESNSGWNAAGGASIATAPPRHNGLVTVGFADGSVREVPASDLPALRWNP